MRTVIARLREEESDLLDDSDLGSVSTPEQRQQLYHHLDDAFATAAEGVVSLLDERRERTAQILDVAADAAAGVAELDILSDETVGGSGVFEFERLLPSHSIAVTCTEDVVAELARRPEVEAIHENFIYEISFPIAHPEDDVLAERLASGVPSTWQLDRLRVARSITNGQGVKVAVLDTGLDPSHPEFAGTSIVDSMAWDDIGTPVSSGPLRDTHYHGTLVSSILCGQNIGVAPGIELYVGTIAPRGRASFRQIDRGLDWAARSGVDIISLSVGKPGYRNDLERFVRFAEAAGVLVAAAIGNSGPEPPAAPATMRRSLAWGLRMNSMSSGRKAPEG